MDAGPPRLELAQLPTPLHPAARLSAELGVEVWFKRDDLTGLGLGGNKLRPLEYLLADAVGQGCDCLVTGAGPQSNWTMLAALTAIRLGLEPHVVCYGDPAPEWGNLLLHRRLGTMLSWTGDPDRPSVDAGMDEVGARLRGAGRRPYVVPRGGATAVGALGYTRATVELDRQLEAVGLRPETLWLAAGSGGTMAGLILGSARLPTSYTVQGVTVSRPDVAMQVDELARGAAALLGDTDLLGGTDLPGGTDTLGGAGDLPPADVLGGWIGAG
ncbi:MAG: pyridoxal-phosphate dependent enzyme, partial [Geodermatophilaceae bacterium]|nr:pyridoxal-phosphate dependent enzyme [Geodermatophilaceae bacterium]